MAALANGKIMKRILFAFLLILISSSALAEWTRMVSGTDGSTLYMDLNTHRRNGDKVKLWTMQNFKSFEGEAKLKHLSNKVQWELDCKEEQVRMPAYLTFDGAKGSGKSVSHVYTPNERWQPISPESLSQIVFEAGCQTPTERTWVLVRSIPGSSNTVNIYYNPSKVDREADLATMWVLFDARGEEYGPTGESFSMQILSQFDCKAPRARDMGGLSFPANMGIGKGSSMNPAPWYQLVSGTPGSYLWEVACVRSFMTSWGTHHPSDSLPDNQNPSLVSE